MSLLDDIEQRAKAEMIGFYHQGETKFLFIQDALNHVKMFGHENIRTAYGMTH